MKWRGAGWVSCFVVAVSVLAAPAAAAPSAVSAAPASPAPDGAAVSAAPAASPAPDGSAAPAAPTAPSAVLAAPGRVTVGTGEAVIHLAVNYRDAWLETRSYIDQGEFVRTCAAPCDLKLNVDGLEARVTAPGMTTSNTFRFDPGAGAAGVRVDGGSATARRVGIITLAAGIPIAMAGMALFAQGKLKDESGLRAGGIAGLALGGASIGVSLPLLLLGTTHVKSAKGSLIARLLTSPAQL